MLRRAGDTLKRLIDGGAPRMETAVDCADRSGVPSPSASTRAITRTEVVRVPLVSVVVTSPLPLVTAVVGLTVSPPKPVSENVTATPATGWVLTSVTRNVSADCSVRPEARTPIAVGLAMANWIDPAGSVGVAVAVAVPVALAELVGVLVAGGVPVTVSVGVLVLGGVEVLVGTGLSVGVNVSVGVGVPVGVAMGVPVGAGRS